MKKLISVGFACIALTFAVGAANVGTIDNDYPGDTEAQAQMLCDLGLFRGTEKGFELDKPMTRAEAAAMLTRLLGAEGTALSSEWTHPFTDVPSWADQYVGWLYESGLTKGTSATTYGAEENVTCGQYSVFLARALGNRDDGSELANAEEVAACDSAGFVRGDAVSLSVRALGKQYETVPNNVDAILTLAHHLMDCGVYTAEQFRQAAWNVLPREYARADSYGTLYTDDGVLSCVIAGVRVLADEESQVVPDRDWIDGTGRLYGRITAENGDMTVYRIDSETLQTNVLFSGDSQTRLLCTAGGKDYLVANQQLVVVENQVAHHEPIAFSGERSFAAVPYDDAGDCWIFPSNQGICLVDDNGLQIFGTQPVNKVEKIGDLILAQYITAGETTVSAWTWTGESIGIYTVPNPMPEELQDNLMMQADVSVQADGVICGAAGMYRVVDNQLVQITARPVYSEVQQADGTYIIVTHDFNRAVYYTESALLFRTGDTLVRVLPDGTEEWLLPQLPEGSLLLGEVDLLDDGRIQFTTLKPTEPRMMGQFTCVLDDGKITVTDATNDIFYIWGDDAISVEQARLDELGIGSGAN